MNSNKAKTTDIKSIFDQEKALQIEKNKITELNRKKMAEKRVALEEELKLLKLDIQKLDKKLSSTDLSVSDSSTDEQEVKLLDKEKTAKIAALLSKKLAQNYL